MGSFVFASVSVCLICILLQAPVISIALYSGANDFVVVLINSIKDISILTGVMGCMVFSFSKTIRSLREMKLYIWFILLIVFFVIVSESLNASPPSAMAVQLRLIILPWIGFILGWFIASLCSSTGWKIYYLCMLFGFVVLISGLLERLLLDTKDMGAIAAPFWQSRLGEDSPQMTSTLMMPWAMVYYSPDGTESRRMAGFMFDPILCGLWSSFFILQCCVLAWLRSVGGMKLLVILSGFTLVSIIFFLTLARAPIIIVIFGPMVFTIVILLGYIFKIRSALVLSIFFTLPIIFTIGLALNVGPYLLNYMSGESHLHGLKTGVEVGLAHPLGLGLGNVGNASAAVIGDDKYSRTVGGDSWLGTVLASTGIIGGLVVFFPYALCLAELARMLSVGKRIFAQHYSRVFAIGSILTGVFACMSISETVNATSFLVPVMILVGFCVSYSRQVDKGLSIQYVISMAKPMAERPASKELA